VDFNRESIKRGGGKMKKLDANLVLRVAFGIFFFFWGIERIRRADLWASEEMLGSFYGSAGTLTLLVIVIAIVQVLVALAFFANFKAKIAAVIALVMFASSLIVTFVPLVTYILSGDTPIPNILFLDHFPLLGGAWAIYATSE
jgi:uncharacterized membrane protein YphA (DoxX/SURF4 family)